MQRTSSPTGGMQPIIRQAAGGTNPRRFERTAPKNRTAVTGGSGQELVEKPPSAACEP